MDYAFKVIHELKLMIVVHYGDKNHQDFINTREAVFNHPDFQYNYSIVIDFILSRLKITTEELNELTNYFITTEIPHEEPKMAYITTTPKQVAFTTLYNQKMGISEKQFVIVSTLNKALYWLNIDIENWDRINNEINMLKEMLEDQN